MFHRPALNEKRRIVFDKRLSLSERATLQMLIEDSNYKPKAK